MNKETQRYKDAVWKYILDHSDVQRSGALFVKFHTENRMTFEKRIHSRLEGYTRENPERKMGVMELTKNNWLELKKIKKLKLKQEEVKRNKWYRKLWRRMVINGY